MKLSTTDIYDVSQISNTKAYEDLKDFIEYVNNFNRDIVKSYTNGITLGDNITSVTRNIELFHGVPLTLPGIPNYNIVSINSRTPVRSFNTFRNAQSDLVLTVWFDQAIQVLANRATWLRGQMVRYTALSTDNIKPGDFVTFSGFGNQPNNGSFQVLKVEGQYLYCLNINRDSATDDEMKPGFVGNTSSKINIGVTFVI